jgi:WD40 repeat protein
VATGRAGRSADVGASYVYSIAFSPDGKTLATGNTGGLGLWDVATFRPKSPPVGHQGQVLAVLFLAGGRELLTGGYGRPVFRWDRAGRQLAQWSGPGRWNGNLVLSPDGKTLAAAGPDLSVVLLDPVTGKERLRFTNHLPRRASASAPMSLVFTPDSRRIFSATQGIDFHIRAWEAATGKEHLTIDTTREATSGLALSPDGRTLYAARLAGPVRVHDAATGKELRQIGKPGLGASRLTLSPDGRRLAAILSSETCVWDAATGAELVRLPRPRGYAPGLAFSVDGRTLALLSEDEPLRLWEVASGQVRLEVRGHEGAARCVVFARDGRLLATGSADTTALLWDLRALPLVGDTVPGRSLDALWEGLASDSKTAFRAVTRMVQAGNKSVALVAERLKPTKGRALERLIAELDDKGFRVRERATQELVALGHVAEPALRQALARPTSTEARLRIERILARLGENRLRQADRLRGLRALEVLEGIGSLEARKLLEAFAGGIPGAEQTVEARAALPRLAAPRAAAP